MNLKPLKSGVERVAARIHFPCPACASLEALGDEDLRELESYTAGEISALSPKLAGVEWPAPSPWCRRCRKVAAMDEQVIDAKLSRLLLKAKTRRA
jgi:hypothetical protein